MGAANIRASCGAANGIAGISAVMAGEAGLSAAESSGAALCAAAFSGGMQDRSRRHSRHHHAPAFTQRISGRGRTEPDPGNELIGFSGCFRNTDNEQTPG